jgi:electron transfer flavoprotein alpha/beta subunit
MNIIVCVKRVSMIQEVDLEIDVLEKDVQENSLASVINDRDNY